MNTIIPFSLIIFLAITPVVHGAILKTEFSTGKYENNQFDNEWLGIQGVEGLEVKIQGETEENYDFIIIYNKQGRIIKRLSGMIDTTLTVKGNSAIRVVFKSDGRTTKEGVTVQVTPLSPASFFNEIKSQLLEIVTHLFQNGTENIYVEISQNNIKFEELHHKIELTSDQDIGERIAEMAAILAKIAQSYHRIAVIGENIIATHQLQLKKMDQLKNDTDVQIDKIFKEREQLSKEREQLLAEMETKLADPIERQKKQYLIDNDEKNSDNLDKLQKAWEDFHEVQDTLKEQLTAYSKKVGLLLYYLRVDAKIYKQVANVLSLRQTELMILNNLPNLSKFQEILEQLENSENEILELLDKLKKTHF